MNTDYKKLSDFAIRTFSLIELIEVTSIDEKSFIIIRKKLLDLANDIRRYAESFSEGSEQHG